MADVLVDSCTIPNSFILYPHPTAGTEKSGCLLSSHSSRGSYRQFGYGLLGKSLTFWLLGETPYKVTWCMEPSFDLKQHTSGCMPTWSGRLWGVGEGWFPDDITHSPNQGGAPSYLQMSCLASNKCAYRLSQCQWPLLSPAENIPGKATFSFSGLCIHCLNSSSKRRKFLQSLTCAGWKSALWSFGSLWDKRYTCHTVPAVASAEAQWIPSAQVHCLLPALGMASE